MQSFIKKVLAVAGFISIMPFLTYAASVSCTTGYDTDLVGKPVTITAHISGGETSDYDFTWYGDDGIDSNGPEFTHSFTQEGSMTLNVTASSTVGTDVLEGSCSIDIYTDETLPNFSATCEPSTDTGVIGQDITWYSDINGPLGAYSVVWTGTDLNSNETNPQLSYTTSGEKTATMVSFESRYGNDTPIHNAKLTNVACTAPVRIVPENIHNPDQLIVSGSCSASNNSVAVNNSITWTSDLQISGGAAPYQINWTDNEGSMGLGTSITKTYSTAGTKNAYLSVEDDAGQSVDIECGNLSVTNPSDGGSNNNGSDNNNNSSTSTNTTTSTSTSNTTGSTNDNSDDGVTDEEFTTLVNNLIALDLIDGFVLPEVAGATTDATTTASTTQSAVSTTTDSNGIFSAAIGTLGNNFNWILLIVILVIAGVLYFFVIRKKKDETTKTN